MKKLIILVSATAWALSSVSCITNDFDLPPCDSHLRIIPEWINTEPHQPENVHITIAAGQTVVKDTLSTGAGIELDLPAVTYNITGYEDAANTAVSNRIVSVATGSDGLLLDPGPFAGGAVEAEVEGYPEESSVVQVITVPMRQQTRELIIEVIFLNDGFSSVTGISGILRRVIASRDINDGFPPAGGEKYVPAVSYGAIAYAFAGFNDHGTDYFGGSRHLLGIDRDGNQTFELTVYLDDTEETFAIDLSRAFDGFQNFEVYRPWVIQLEIDLSAQLEMTIINWKVVEVPGMIAE